jgi:GGDEF domain-containing protein
MNRQQSLSSLCMIGVVITLLGVLLIAGSRPSAPTSLAGAVVMITGFLCTLSGIFRLPEDALIPEVPQAGRRPAPRANGPGDCEAESASDTPEDEAMARTTECFLTWLNRRDPAADLWADFDRWARDTLNQVLGARRTRCYRVSDVNRHLVSLTDRMEDGMLLGSPIPGLIQHAITSGQRYLRDSGENGDLVNQMAEEWTADAAARAPSSASCNRPDWLLPVREGRVVIGLIAVGELSDEVRRSAGRLDHVGNLLELCWRHVQQQEALAIARRTDRASGVLNRLDLAAQAENLLIDAHREEEPIVLLALSVEGSRRLDDEGQWELRNWIMQQVGMEMRRKLRTDDLVGRFSDDRFVAVLRRLDVSLGRLIASKMLDAVKARLVAESRAAEAITIRCGLVEAGDGSLEKTLGLAFEALQQARLGRQELLVMSPAASGAATVEAPA